MNIKYFPNIPKEYFAPLRVLYLFIKSFINPFVDIALTFFVHLIRFQQVHILFYLKQLFYLNSLVYHQNLSLLQNQKYNF